MRRERRTLCFAKWQVVDFRESKRKGEGHCTGVEDRKSLLHRRHKFHSFSLVCALVDQRRTCTIDQRTAEELGQWPWIGLKDANIGAKWLVILLENTVGGGQRFRGYSRHNTTSPRCSCTHTANMCFCCALRSQTSAAPLLNSNIIPHGISLATEQNVWQKYQICGTCIGKRVSFCHKLLK